MTATSANRDTDDADHTDGTDGTATGSTEISGVDLELTDVVKKYPGQETPAVDRLSLHIPAGEIVMFVGPSGCGKTTSLKMINRLIEPTSGTITIGGDDVKQRSVDELRRHIGYVIQGGSLFPHMTVAQNIAMVPKLLKWESSRIDSRVDELLDLVSLDPGKYRDRYPRELSGGQQQRVGVARGLAADPPVILMDEPFGAVDPITRQRLQDELMSIQADLRKTIVCVTHDIDEAIKLGDRICILREGAEIAQYDTPENILADPANRFVEDFVGAGSSLKQLTLMRVSDIDLLEWPTATVGEPSEDAVRRAKEAGERSVIILDDRRRPRDWVWLRDLEESRTVPQPTRDEVLGVDRRATLNDALDDMLTSSHGGAIVTGRREEFIGVASFSSVTRQIQNAGSGSEPEGEQLDRGTPA